MGVGRWAPRYLGQKEIGEGEKGALNRGLIVIEPRRSRVSARRSDVGARLRTTIIIWDGFRDVVVRFRDDASTSENETLENLMQGVLAQLDMTPDCGLIGRGQQSEGNPSTGVAPA